MAPAFSTTGLLGVQRRTEAVLQGTYKDRLVLSSSKIYCSLSGTPQPTANTLDTLSKRLARWPDLLPSKRDYENLLAS